jgi:hypothetical protein
MAGKPLVWPIEDKPTDDANLVENVEQPRASGKISELVSVYETASDEDKQMFKESLTPEEHDLLLQHVKYKKEAPRNEQAPWVSDESRSDILNYGTVNTDLIKRLNAADPEHHYSLRDGEIVTRKKGTGEQYKIDPTGFSSVGEFGKDVNDISYDIASGIGGATGSLAGAALAAAATAGNPAGVIAGGVGGGGTAGAFMEYKRQQHAVDAGLQDEIDWEQVGMSAGLEGGASMLGVGLLPKGRAMRTLFGKEWDSFATGINKQLTPIVKARMAATDNVFYPQIPGHVLDSYRNQHGAVQSAEKELRERVAGQVRNDAKLGIKDIPKETLTDEAAQSIVENSLKDLHQSTGESMGKVLKERHGKIKGELADTPMINIESAKNALEAKRHSILRGRSPEQLTDAERELVTAIDFMYERLFTIEAVAKDIPEVPASYVFDGATLGMKETPAIPMEPGAKYRADVSDNLPAEEAYRMRQEADMLAEAHGTTPLGAQKKDADSKTKLAAAKSAAAELRDLLEKANPKLGKANEMYSDARSSSTNMRRKKMLPDDWHRSGADEFTDLPDGVDLDAGENPLRMSILSPESNQALGRIGGVTHKDQISALGKLMRQNPKGDDLLDKYEKTLALKEFLLPDKGVKSKWGATSTSNTLENIRAQSLIHSLLGDFKPANVPIGSLLAWALTSPSVLMGSPKGFKRAHNMARKAGKGYRLIGPPATRAGTQAAKYSLFNEDEEKEE